MTSVAAKRPSRSRRLEFISDDLWPFITKSASTGPAIAAVAYLGKAAARLLPLKRGSLIVCDCSKSAVKAGQTNPSAVLQLIKRGVEVHSWEGLHAKVIAFSKVAFVGSMNASTHSANVLKEAAVRVTDANTIAAIGDWILSLKGDVITPKWAKELQKLYRPPIWEPSGKQAKRHRSTTQTSILWVVKIDKDASDQAHEEAEKNESSARKLLADKRRFALDWFEWNGAVPSDLLKCGGNVMIVRKEDREWIVYRSERFLRVERVLGFKRKSIIRLEERLPRKWVPLSVLRSENPNLGALIKSISNSKFVRAADSVRALLNLL